MKNKIYRIKRKHVPYILAIFLPIVHFPKMPAICAPILCPTRLVLQVVACPSIIIRDNHRASSTATERALATAML